MSHNHRTHSAPVTIERETRWGWRLHDQPPRLMIPLCPDPDPDPGSCPGPYPELYHYRYPCSCPGPELYPDHVLIFGCDRRTNFDLQLLWTWEVPTQCLYWIVVNLLEWREWKELTDYQIDIWMENSDKRRQGGRGINTRKGGKEAEEYNITYRNIMIKKKVKSCVLICM